MLPSISIAAPAYNEGATIGPLVQEWAAYLLARFAPEACEIVICDDGSRDETSALLADLATRFPCVRPCRHAVNQGAAAALRTAIGATTKEWVLLLDADGQYPIENLATLMGAHDREPVPASIGWRRRKEDSAFARAGSWLSGSCANLIYGTHYRDFNCALKLVQGPLLRSLTLEARGLNYSTEISARLLERGVKMKEVEIAHRPRAGGRSHRALLRDSMQRLLFVVYLALRQGLVRLGVVRKEEVP